MRNLAICAVTGALIATGCGISVNLGEASLTGSGHIVTDVRDVPSFREIEINDDFNVVVEAGRPQLVKITGDDNLVEVVETVVRGDRLRVRTNYNLRSRDDVEVIIHVPELNALHSSGSSDVAAYGVEAGEFEIQVTGSSDLSAEGAVESLDVTVSGSGEVRFAGTAEAIRASVSGSGEIDLIKAPAREAAVHVSGSGEVDLAVSEYLDATVTGSGEVHYVGTPRVRSHVTGSGEVHGG